MQKSPKKLFRRTTGSPEVICSMVVKVLGVWRQRTRNKYFILFHNNKIPSVQSVV